MMEALHFLRPDWFYAFIPAAILFYLALNHSIGSISWKKICDAKLLPHILIGKPIKSSRLSFIIPTLATVLCIIAAAGPVWKKLPTPVFRDQSSLVIAVDLSRSMDASDIKPTRLKRAKLKLIDILEKRKEGQTALVVYAANAFTVTPLTSDTATIANLVNAIDTQMMPAQGSNVADALKTATALLNQAGETEGDVLLITDSIQPDDFFAITDLTNKGHRLSIMGVGTRDGGPIILDSGFLQDANGAIVIPKLDVSALQKAALAGHGLFVGLQTTDKDVDKLTALFSRDRAKTESIETELTADIWYEEGPWLLLIVLPLVALLSRRGLIILLAAIIIPMPEPSYAFEANELWLNENQRAMRHFEKGEHEEAAKLFKKNNWKASALYRNGDYEKVLESLESSGEKPDSDALYNKGNALSQLQRYQEAIEAYDEAVKLNPKNEDAIYNRELVKKKLQEQDPEQDKNKKDPNKKDQDKQKQDKENKDKQEQNKSDKKDEQKPSDKEGEKSQDEKSQDGNEVGKESKDKDSAGKESEDQNSNEKNKDKDNAEKKDAENKSENKPEEKSEENKQDQAEDTKENQQQGLQQKDDLENSEENKATEQWLKRIPDDPGRLLRNKFKYQYQNMPGQQPDKQPW